MKVPFGTGTAVHVRKILVRHLTLMKDYEGTFRDWYICIRYVEVRYLLYSYIIN
jgi:hypothetical protein